MKIFDPIRRRMISLGDFDEGSLYINAPMYEIRVGSLIHICFLLGLHFYSFNFC